MQSRIFGITTKNLQKLASDRAERNNKNHSFDTSIKIVGRIWTENFLKRNSDLSLQIPKTISGARAVGFNEVVVNSFLIYWLMQLNLTSDKIFM